MDDKAILKSIVFRTRAELCDFVNETQVRIEKIETVILGKGYAFCLWYWE